MTLLAERFGGQKTTISKMLRRERVQARGPGGHDARIVTPADEEEIERLYVSGWGSQHKIGERLNIRQGRVSEILRARGVFGGNDHMSGMRHPKWKGGTIVGGYRMVRVQRGSSFRAMANKGGYVMEHRLVMAQSLGRNLMSNETVHHINGERTDNRLENLQLRQGIHGKGTVMICKDCGSRHIGFEQLADKT